MKAWRQIWAKKALRTAAVLAAFIFTKFRQWLWMPPHHCLGKTSLSRDSTSQRSSCVNGAQLLVSVPLPLNKLKRILLLLYVPEALSPNVNKKEQKKNSCYFKYTSEISPSSLEETIFQLSSKNTFSFWLLTCYTKLSYQSFVPFKTVTKDDKQCSSTRQLPKNMFGMIRQGDGIQPLEIQ